MSALEKEANMNTAPMYVQNPINSATHGVNSEILKKLPWSLAFAVIPFIPDILETIRSIPTQIARNGYELRIKYDQIEFRFNKVDNGGETMKGGDNTELDD